MIRTDRQLILLHQKEASREEIILRLADTMQKAGYIGPTYGEAAVERERNYPTGLPSEGVPIAIPHAFSKDVVKTGVACAVLDEPVEFVNMGDDSDLLPVEMVFLMANADGGDAYMEDLQELMQMFSSEEFLLKLRNAESVDEFAYVMEHSELYAEED